MKAGRDKPAFRVALPIRINRALFCVLVAAGMISSACAASYTWDGGGADDNWTTGANWVGDPATPNFGNSILTFQGDTRNTPNNNMVNGTTYALIFGNDGSAGKTAAFTLGGNVYTIRSNSGVVTTTANTAGSTITDTIVMGLDLNNQSTRSDFPFTINQQSGSVQHNLTINGTISQTGNCSLTKLGGGLLTLGGANTYSGKTLVSAGKILMGNVLALQNSYYDTASVAGGLDLNGNTTPTLGGLTGSVNLSGTLITGYDSISSLTLNPQTGITATYSGNLGNGNGNMALVKTGAGTQILSSTANSYSGTTTVSAGTLTLSATGALPSGNNVVLNGGTLNNAGVVTQTAGTLTLTANSTIAQQGTGTVPSGGGSLRFSGAVGDWTGLNLTLRGSLGPTTLRFGTDSTGLSAAQLARITHTLLSGAVKTVTINGSGYVTSGSSDGWDGGADGNWSSVWDGSMIAGGEDATATLWGTSSGSMVAVDALITIGHIKREGNKDSTISSSGGGILTLAVSSGMSTINSGSNVLTISAPLAGVDGLEIVNAGTVVLSGDNSYTGGTKLTLGTLRVGHANALGGDGSGTIALNGGTIQSSDGTARSFGNAVTIGGNFTIGGTGNMTFSNTGASALGATRTITVTTAGVRATFAQAFSGTAGITKAGAGTLVLSGASTYDGVTTINAASGTIEITTIGSVNGSPSSLGIPTTAANGRIMINHGATLVYTGTAFTTDREVAFYYYNITGPSTIDQSGTGLLKFTTNFIATSNGGNGILNLQGSTTGTGEISGAIGNASGTRLTAVSKSGTGTWTLSGNNTYTGATTVNDGTLALGVNNTLKTANNVVLAGGTLAAGSFTNSLGTLTLSGTSTITLGSGKLAFANSAAAPWSGTLTLTGTLDAQTLQFGTSTNGLAGGQLASITYLGRPVELDGLGYVKAVPPAGTVLIVR